MRLLTETNAKIVVEVLEQEIEKLQQQPKSKLRLQNRIRLIQIALSELQKKKKWQNK